MAPYPTYLTSLFTSFHDARRSYSRFFARAEGRSCGGCTGKKKKRAVQADEYFARWVRVRVVSRLVLFIDSHM